VITLGISDALLDFAKVLWDGTKDFGGILWNGTKDFGRLFWDSGIGFLRLAWDGLWSVGQSILGGLWDGVKVLAGALWDLIPGIDDLIKIIKFLWDAAGGTTEIVSGVVGAVAKGVGWVVQTGSALLNMIPFFHEGGHVGKKVGKNGGTPEEVMAILHTDEVVLTKQHQKNLLTQMDFLRELGVAAPSSVASLCPVQQFIGPEIDYLPSHINNSGSITVSAPIEVIIQHSGAMDDATAARFGKKVAETTIGNIYEAFRKKGIHPGPGNAALKP